MRMPLIILFLALSLVSMVYSFFFLWRFSRSWEGCSRTRLLSLGRFCVEAAIIKTKEEGAKKTLTSRHFLGDQSVRSVWAIIRGDQYRRSISLDMALSMTNECLQDHDSIFWPPHLLFCSAIMFGLALNFCDVQILVGTQGGIFD